MTTRAAGIVHELMRSYPDFPRQGICYRDLAPVFADGGAFRVVVDALSEFAGRVDGPVAAVAGVESRGFILAAAVARSIGCGMFPIRKAGKLPGRTLSESYALEYGDDVLEVQPDLLPPGSKVLLLDDLLATGGTLRASARLLERAGLRIGGVGVVLELAGLGGRDVLAKHPVSSITSVR